MLVRRRDRQVGPATCCDIRLLRMWEGDCCGRRSWICESSPRGGVCLKRSREEGDPTSSVASPCLEACAWGQMEDEDSSHALSTTVDEKVRTDLETLGYATLGGGFFKNTGKTMVSVWDGSFKLPPASSAVTAGKKPSSVFFLPCSQTVPVTCNYYFIR